MPMTNIFYNSSQIGIYLNLSLKSFMSAYYVPGPIQVAFIYISSFQPINNKVHWL